MSSDPITRPATGWVAAVGHRAALLWALGGVLVAMLGLVFWHAGQPEAARAPGVTATPFRTDANRGTVPAPSAPPRIQPAAPLAHSDTPPVQAAAPQPADRVPAVAPATRSTETDSQSPKIADLLSRAEQDLSSFRLSRPKGNNALERYWAVLEVDKGNKAAHLGLFRVAQTYLLFVEQVMNEDNEKLRRTIKNLARLIESGRIPLHIIEANANAGDLDARFLRWSFPLRSFLDRKPEDAARNLEYINRTENADELAALAKRGHTFAGMIWFVLAQTEEFKHRDRIQELEALLVGVAGSGNSVAQLVLRNCYIRGCKGIEKNDLMQEKWAKVLMSGSNAYFIRAQLSETISAGSRTQSAVTEFFQANGHLPAAQRELPPPVVSKRAHVSVDSSATVTIKVMAESANLRGKHIILRPNVLPAENGRKTLIWKCSSPDIEARFLPRSCRG